VKEQSQYSYGIKHRFNGSSERRAAERLENFQTEACGNRISIQERDEHRKKNKNAKAYAHVDEGDASGPEATIAGPTSLEECHLWHGKAVRRFTEISIFDIEYTYLTYFDIKFVSVRRRWSPGHREVVGEGGGVRRPRQAAVAGHAQGRLLGHAAEATTGGPRRRGPNN